MSHRPNYITELWYANGSVSTAAEYLQGVVPGIFMAFVHKAYNAGGLAVIPNYRGGLRRNVTSVFQSIYGVGSGQTYAANAGGWWSSTAAITTITITGGGNFGINSVFTLYGLL